MPNYKILSFQIENLPESLINLGSSVGDAAMLVLWLNVWRLKVFRPLLFFKSTASDLLNELPRSCKAEWSMLRGSTLGNSTSRLSLLWSRCGNKEEHPLVDSECESSSPALKKGR